LEFRHSFESAPDREVSSGNHHAASIQSQKTAQHRWKRFKSATRLDFDHNTQVKRIEALQRAQQLFHVPRAIGEGQRHNVGVPRNNSKIGEVLPCQRRVGQR
jgi:hypothetical protein